MRKLRDSKKLHFANEQNKENGVDYRQYNLHRIKIIKTFLIVLEIDLVLKEVFKMKRRR